MAKYHLTKKAVSDLTNIWDYTVKTWSENQAENYYRFLIETCQSIAEKPEIGKQYFEVKQDLWGFKTKKHIIFYRKLNPNKVKIIRILHERMDLKNRLGK